MVRVRTTIDAPPDAVWESIRDIRTHIDWMADAVAIRFDSDQTEGKGTTFECDTRVGPFRLTDHMEITEWRPRRTMGVRHVGVVEGTGRFTLRARRGNRTTFVWRERLRFPWWMGGPIGALLARPVFHWIWSRNLRRLKAKVEGRSSVPG